MTHVPAWIKAGHFYQSLAADLREEQQRQQEAEGGGGDPLADDEPDFPPATHPFLVSLPCAAVGGGPEQSTDERQALLERLTAAAQYWMVPERSLPVAYFAALFQQMGADLPRVQRWLAATESSRYSPAYRAFLAECSRSRRASRRARFNPSIAAKHGFLNAMIAARAGSRGGWSPWTQRAAAKNGHLDCMRYAHEHGCPWPTTGEAVKDAAEMGHLDCLTYAVEHGCPLPYNQRTHVHPACLAFVQALFPPPPQIQVVHGTTTTRTTAYRPHTNCTSMRGGHHPVRELIWDDVPRVQTVFWRAPPPGTVTPPPL